MGHLLWMIVTLVLFSLLMGTINVTVPSTKLRPGRFLEFDVTSAQRGLAPSIKRLAIIGGMTSSGTATAGTPYQCFSEVDGDTYFGAGSEAALMVRAALNAARKQKRPPPQIWAVGVADAGGSAAATFTLTSSGTATATGTLIIKVAGRLVYVPVTSGDTQNTIATSIDTAMKAMQAKKIMPTSSGVSGAVVTLTAVNKGPVGNDIRTPTIVQAVAGNTVTPAAGVSGSGAYDPTTAFNNLQDKRYARVAIGNHQSGDVTKAKTYIDSVGLPQTKRFSGVILGEYGSVSTCTGLASGGNYRQITVVAARDFPRLPGELAAAFGATVLCKWDNPAQPLDGIEMDEPPCPITSVFTDGEIETLLGGGCTPLTLNTTQDQAVIERWVSTMTTLNGAPFYAALDGMVDMTLAEVALQVDADWALAFPPGTLNDARTIKRVKSVTFDTLKKLEGASWIQNVDAHKDELLVQVDPNNPGRDNLAIPASVVPGLHQLDGLVTLFTEAPQ